MPDKKIRILKFDREEQERQKVADINAIVSDMIANGLSRKQISDGYHTFEELYYHRMYLFSIICSYHKDRAWKSKLHHDGTMHKGNFIVGIGTPAGQYSYHYPLEFWDHFDVKELQRAPKYDGHLPPDIVRLKSLGVSAAAESKH